MRTVVILLLVFLANQSQAQSLMWPIPEPLHDRSYISNYVDLIQGANNGFMDYECGSNHGYDGHQGIDIAAHDFRFSDQGVPIIATAAGTVTSVTRNQFDRNLWPPYEGSGNGLWVQHDDGLYSIYWHLRENSILVEVGERVEAGQFLGYIASSGSSPIPHLHYQLNESSNLSDYLPLLAGACGETDISVFSDQPDYVGNAPLRILQKGLHTEFSLADGIYQSGALAEIKQGLIEPFEIGSDETQLGVYVQFQGNVGQQIHVDLEDPNGTLVAEKQVTVFNKRRYGWYVLALDLPETVESGLWRVRISDSQNELETLPVRVGAKTVYPPRFFPLAGRSFRLDGTRQNHLLEIEHTQEASLHLAGAPAGVSLNGQQLIIRDRRQYTDWRNSEFAVIARNTSPTGLQDVFHVQLINPAAPINGIAIGPEASGFWMDPEHPGQGICDRSQP